MNTETQETSAVSAPCARKITPGDETHLTLLMARHSLNLVVGQDRDHLLAWGRDVWQAALLNAAYTGGHRRQTHGLGSCPFCGSNTAPMVASSYTEHDEDRVHSECFAVVCSATTDATGQLAGGCGAGSGWEDSREAAVAAWNRVPALAAAQQPAGAPLQQQLAEMSEYANRQGDRLQMLRAQVQRLRAENERLTRERDEARQERDIESEFRAKYAAQLKAAAQQPARSSWPTEPLDLVQVVMPDGTHAMLKPCFAYFDAYAMQELEKEAEDAKEDMREAQAISDQLQEDIKDLRAAQQPAAAVEIPNYQQHGQVPTGQPGAEVQHLGGGTETQQ